MPVLSVPETGLSLGPIPDATGSSKSAMQGIQVMRIAFADGAVLEDVLKCGDDLKFVFGKSGRLVYGDQSMEIMTTGQEIRQELYQDGKQPGQLDFVGLFSHTLEVRELDETIDESVHLLRENYARIRDQKAASTTMVVDSSELPPAKQARRFGPLSTVLKGRPRPLSQPRSASATSSARPSRSPLAVHEQSTTSSTAELHAKLDGLRVPLLHLLALGSASEHSLATKTKATEEMCLRILQRVANRVKAGREWELIDDHYKDLDIWEFPYKSQDRETAVTNCRAAFNRMRLVRDAPEWQLLLQPGDRGKVDPNPMPAQPTKPPAKPINSSTGASDSTKSPHVLADAKSAGGDVGIKTPQASAKATKSKQKNPLDNILNKKKKPTVSAKPKGPVGRPPKSAANKSQKPAARERVNPKIKSKERVEDSDEDIEMEEVKLSPPKAVEKMPLSPRPTPGAVSKASSAVNSDGEAERPPSVKTQPVKTSPKRKARPYLPAKSKPTGYVKAPSNNAKNISSKDQITGRSASNSPPKPSPLGSSPPLNASEVEEVSGAQSPPVQVSYNGTSTASQSPSDSLADVPKGTKSRNLQNPLKRKAPVPLEHEERDSRPPTSASSSSSTYKRQHTGSPDESLMKLARQFKEQYATYERLYREAQSTTDARRKQERVEKVLNMHHDLEKLKAQIVTRC